MKAVPRSLHLLCLVLLLISSAASRAEFALTQHFDYSSQGFCINLPENWAVISAEKLAAMNDLAAKLNPKCSRPVLNYGYQMTNAEEFVFPPFILIRVSEPGQPPDISEVRKETSGDSESGVKWLGSLEPRFDTNLNAFLFTGEVELPLPNKPVVGGASAFFLTKSGAIKLYCIAAKADEEKLAGLFEQVIQHVQISSDHRYHPPGRIGLLVGVAAIIVVVVVLSKAKPAKT